MAELPVLSHVEFFIVQEEKYTSAKKVHRMHLGSGVLSWVPPNDISIRILVEVPF